MGREREKSEISGGPGGGVVRRSSGEQRSGKRRGKFHNDECVETTNDFFGVGKEGSTTGAKNSRERQTDTRGCRSGGGPGGLVVGGGGPVVVAWVEYYCQLHRKLRFGWEGEGDETRDDVARG